MFRMNDYHVVEGMTWDEAVRIIKGRGKGNLLDGMEYMTTIGIVMLKIRRRTTLARKMR